MKKLLGCFLCVMLLVFGVSVPGANALNLYAVPSSGIVDGAIFEVPTVLMQTSSSGTGVIDPFVRIQAKESEMGNNTDGTRYYDEKAGIWTHSILRSDLHQEGNYFEFLLDINERASNPYISLYQMEIWYSDTVGGSPSDHINWAPTDYNLIWELESEIVNLDYNLWSGSGNSIDMIALIPVSEFAGISPSANIYLWSAFRGTELEDTDAGFEEWCMREATGVPEPATMFLLGTGLIGLALFGRQRFKK